MDLYNHNRLHITTTEAFVCLVVNLLTYLEVCIPLWHSFFSCLMFGNCWDLTLNMNLGYTEAICSRAMRPQNFRYETALTITSFYALWAGLNVRDSPPPALWRDWFLPDITQWPACINISQTETLSKALKKDGPFSNTFFFCLKNQTARGH